LSDCPRCQQAMPEGATQCPACGAHDRRGFFGRLVGNLRSPFVPDAPFSMTVDDVLVMPGRGAVVTGRVSAGVVRVGQPVSFQTPTGPTRVCAVQGIEKERRQVGVARAGETVGLLITGVDREDVVRGTVILGR
jgi:translation elongation factor EF-Tu-like GTPase